MAKNTRRATHSTATELIPNVFGLSAPESNTHTGTKRNMVRGRTERGKAESKRKNEQLVTGPTQMKRTILIHHFAGDHNTANRCV